MAFKPSSILFINRKWPFLNDFFFGIIEFGKIKERLLSSNKLLPFFIDLIDELD